MRHLFILAAFLALPVSAQAQLMEDAMAACTRELKICPDGTGVGRTGPDCAFAPCPGETPSAKPGFVAGSPGHSGGAMPEPMPPATPAPRPPAERPEHMCTMDAKICPDGTGVGRTGPNCEFAPCPGEAEHDPPEPEDEQEDGQEDGQDEPPEGEQGWVY